MPLQFISTPASNNVVWVPFHFFSWEEFDIWSRCFHSFRKRSTPQVEQEWSGGGGSFAPIFTCPPKTLTQKKSRNLLHIYQHHFARKAGPFYLHEMPISNRPLQNRPKRFNNYWCLGKIVLKMLSPNKNSLPWLNLKTSTDKLRNVMLCQKAGIFLGQGKCGGHGGCVMDKLWQSRGGMGLSNDFIPPENLRHPWMAKQKSLFRIPWKPIWCAPQLMC